MIKKSIFWPAVVLGVPLATGLVAAVVGGTFAFLFLVAAGVVGYVERAKVEAWYYKHVR
jgi:hypothetical protein